MPLHVAAVGLGWVTTHRHLPTMLRNPDYQIAGVISRRPGVAARTAQRLGLSHFADTHDLEKIDWLKDVDAVTFGTASDTHAPLVKKALTMGKHVLVEKPFAMSVDEGEAMCQTARDHRRVLAVVHNAQFCRAAKRMTAELAKGRLGPIRRIAMMQMGNPKRLKSDWYERLPLGLFYDESPHYCYLLRAFAGDMLRLQQAQGVASLSGSSTPASVSLLYRNPQNIPVTINCQFDSALSEWHLLVTGERALGILDVFRNIYLRLPNDGRHGIPEIFRTSVCAIYQHLIQHIPLGLNFLRGRLDYGNDEVFSRFAKAAQSGTQPAGISMDDALAVLKMQHEAIAAIQQNWLQ